MVKISYKNLQHPVTYIKDAMKTAARVVDIDAIPGLPPQGDAIGDVKGTLILIYNKIIVKSNARLNIDC